MEHNATNARSDDRITLSPQEACRQLGIGTTSLYALIKNKKIPAYKMGRKTLILKSDIEKFIMNLPALDTSRPA